MYKQKYLKYKKKYLNILENQVGGNKSRLLIFDFDQTLATSSSRVTPVDKMKLCELFEDTDFINELTKFKEKGNYVAILSFGFKDIIEKFLMTNKLVDLFDYIYTPAIFGLDEGVDYTVKLDGKNMMIEKLLEIINNDELKDNRTKIMLVDDSRDNIFRASLKGYYAIKSENDGLKLTRKDTIMQFMNGLYKRNEMCKNIIDEKGRCEKGYKLHYFHTGEICCVKPLF